MRLLETTLPDPESGEAGQRLAVERGTRSGGDVERGRELPIGVLPASAGDEHTAVQGAALGVQERAAVLLDEAVRDLAPLGGSLQIGRHLAGVEHVATRVDDRVEARSFASERGGHRLVDHRETLRAVAHRDPDASEL